MTCPTCHQDGGHYLGCRQIDQDHDWANFWGVLVFLGFLIVVVAVMLWVDRAGATPELEEQLVPVHSFWQDGFNVPEGYQSAEDPAPEVVAPVVANWGEGVEMWRPLVVAAFPPSEVETAMCVMRGESQGNPGARNASGASGLFQVMPFWAMYYDLPASALMIPEVNVNVAAAIQASEGWRAWTWYNRGHCS